MHISRNIIMVITLIAAGILITSAAIAYPFTPLNVRTALEKADAVYIVEITSIDADTSSAKTNQSSSLPDRDVYAHILGTIKGATAENIHITVPQNTNLIESPSYVNYKIGEVCLVFLKGNSSPYMLLDPDSSNLLDVAKPDTAVFKYSTDIAYDRLAKCLMWTVNGSKGWIRLQAIRQLGYLGDHRAASLLRQFAKSDDIALRSLSYEARIHIGDPPDVNDMITILDMTPESINENQSHNGNTGNRYGNEYLQNLLFDAVWQSIIPEQKFGIKLPVSKVEGFDYLAFFEKAMNTKSFRTIRDARSQLAGSLGELKDPKATPILMRLLDDEDAQVRYMATWALNEIYGGLDSAGDANAFIKDEVKYQTYWKAFWKEHGQVKE